MRKQIEVSTVEKDTTTVNILRHLKRLLEIPGSPSQRNLMFDLRLGFFVSSYFAMYCYLHLSEQWILASYACMGIYSLILAILHFFIWQKTHKLVLLVLAILALCVSVVVASSAIAM